MNQRKAVRKLTPCCTYACFFFQNISPKYIKHPAQNRLLADLARGARLDKEAQGAQRATVRNAGDHLVVRTFGLASEERNHRVHGQLLYYEPSLWG